MELTPKQYGKYLEWITKDIEEYNKQFKKK